MNRQGKIRIVAGCFLAAVTVFAALSVLSFHSTDPGWADFRSDRAIYNWCGTVGALFSGFLMYHFGAPATYLGVGLLVFWVYLLLSSREKLPDAYLKIFGSVVFVLSISSLTALAGMRRYFQSVVGVSIERYTTFYFGDLGAFLLLSLVMVLSLLLATDFLIVAPVGRLALVFAKVMRAGLSKLFISIRSRARKTASAARVTRPEPAPRPVSPAAKSTAAVSPAAKSPAAESPAAKSPVEAKKPLPVMPVTELKRPAAAPAAGQLPRSDEPAPKPLPVQSKSAAAHKKTQGGYVFPPLSLLDPDTPDDAPVEDEYIQEKAKVLEDTLAEFGVAVKVVSIETGPVITQYELELAPGIKVNRVVSLSDDISMALKAPSVRIVAPIPGRDSVGVEVPNTKTAIVRLKGLVEQLPPDKVGAIPVYLARDAQGQPLVTDLTELPHLLIAGATGAGKSVCINSVILSVLMTQHPDDVKLLLVDPKMVELSAYKDVPHLICPVVTDMKKAATILEWACVQMDARYDYLSAAGVKHISRYNKLGPRGVRERLGVPLDAEIEIPDKMPYVVIIIDELADLMMVAAKDIETFITRLAQKSRAVGLHLVLATQRPSVDVITGLIKSNLPARLSFKVSSKVDSRTILDENGAEKLLGRGDMLFHPPTTMKLVRAQGTLVSEDEIRRVVEYVKDQGRPSYDSELVGWRKAESAGRYSGSSDHGEGGSDDDGGGVPGENDPLYDQAVQVVIENQRGSVSLLQRRLEIGYSRAARLIDLMAERGILGPYNGSQAREVIFTPDQWDEMQKELKGRSR